MPQDIYLKKSGGIRSLLHEAVRKIPILVYKFDRLPIRVRVPIDFVQLKKAYDKRYVADLDFPTFCYLAREIL